MTYFRSYFEKNNTIQKNSRINTSKNPATEIYYGDNLSRFIFKIDLNPLIQKVTNGDYIISENTTHTLNLTNCIFGDEQFKGSEKTNSKERATSFDLILFDVPEEWDEGVGFDYVFVNNDNSPGNKTYDVRPSNWFNRTTVDEWSTYGIYSTTPTIIKTIHFDNGDENIKIDITDYINNIILSGGTHNGLGLAFDLPFESLGTDKEQSVSFFTKYTQTFFEPFLETKFNDLIIDNRNHFVEKIEQNLFLYVTKGDNYYDLDELPIVDILDNRNVPLSGLTNLNVIKIKKGIYKLSFILDGVTCDGRKFFYDVWKNLRIDGIDLDDKKQKFVPKPIETYLEFGYDITPKKYKLFFYGINQNEKILRGDVRKVELIIKDYQNKTTGPFDEVYYRIFIKEGKTQVIVHDWTLMNKNILNYFYINTGTYIPREYFIEVKSKVNSEEIYHKEIIKYEIVSER